MKSFRPAVEAQARHDAAIFGDLWQNASNINEDICANRHKGAETSVAAHKRIQRSLKARREAVYAAVKDAGKWGITLDELAVRWGVDCNKISGRLSELARDGRIERQGWRETRSGCRANVWICTK